MATAHAGIADNPAPAAARAPSVAADPLPLRTKLFYGSGAVAYGIKDNGFAVFLLFYYNQVVGLRADLVSLAIALALVIDAFIDPFVGQLSDRTRTPIGRRHPWLYAAALPIAGSWLLLWNPPELPDAGVFLYLVGTALLVRVSLSAVEVPSLAMLPELSRDYDDRTAIMRFRSLFGWGGGLLIMVLAYSVFLVPSARYPEPLLNVDGYRAYALLGAVTMAAFTVLAAAGTHRRIVGQYRAAGAPPSGAESLRDIAGAFRFRPFLMLMFAGVFAFANTGLIFALTPYLLTHVWEFGTTELSLYSGMLFGSVVLAFLLVTRLGARFGKRRGACYAAAFSVLFGTMPYWLRLAGLFPDNGDASLLPALFGLITLGNTGGICAGILTFSMMGDVADAHEAGSGRQTEGLFSAGMWFMQKNVGALGILMSGLIITAVGLPEGASAGTVAEPVVARLALTYAVLVTIIGSVGAWAYLRFPIGRAEQRAALDALARRRLATTTPSPAA